MYSIDMKEAQLILTYSDVFKEEPPNLIDEIKKLNMHKAISIISELIQIRDAKCEPINAFGFQIEIPFEMILKRDYCGMRSKSSDEMMKHSMLFRNRHIISLQMLLILLKKIIIYGDYESFKNMDYKVTKEDYKTIIKLQLIVAEEISGKHEKDMDKNHFLYSTYHLNYRRNLANELLRMYYMMEYLSVNPQIFSSNVQKEYRNYYRDFTSKYGITPTEYNSLLFYELTYYYTEKNFLSQSTCWKNFDLIYGKVKEKEKIHKVIDLLKIEPHKLKKWAEKTEQAEWDFNQFYSFPFLACGKKEYISISDVTLVNAFFEKIFWLIRACYPEQDDRAMAFFGRLFERYIQDLTKDVCKGNYVFIDEFEFEDEKQKKQSSDAYIRKEDALIVVEAKGFSVLIDCMAKNERIEDNNKKLFVNPVLQADQCMSICLDKKDEFKNINEIFIISVTLDNIKAVPEYYNKIYKDIIRNKKCELVKYFFNFSIEEYEMLISLVEKNINIITVLREYFNEKNLYPFNTYIKEKFGNIKMTEFMKKNYDAASNKIKSMFTVEK